MDMIFDLSKWYNSCQKKSRETGLSTAMIRQVFVFCDPDVIEMHAQAKIEGCCYLVYECPSKHPRVVGQLVLEIA